MNGFRIQQILDFRGGMSTRARDDGQVRLDADFGVQLTVLQDVNGGFLELLDKYKC